MRLEDAGEGVMVPSQTGDDALRAVPVDEYETVFSFPTVGQNSEMCLTRCRGFWLTFYVDAARCDSGQGPRGNKTKYCRSGHLGKINYARRSELAPYAQGIANEITNGIVEREKHKSKAM